MSKQRRKHPNLVKTRKKAQRFMRDKDYAPIIESLNIQDLDTVWLEN